MEAKESGGCPVVIGALGAVSHMFKKYTGKLKVIIGLKVIQKTALVGTALLLRKILVTQVVNPLGPRGTCCCLL